MQLVQFTSPDDVKTTRSGILENDKIVEVRIGNSSNPVSMVELLHHDNYEDILQRAANNPVKVYQSSSVNLLSPITKPDKIIGLALNYKEHCKECTFPVPPQPVPFSKYSSTIIGPGDAITIPKVSETLDWEIELAVIIGKKGKHIRKEDAFDYVFGYTMAQDLSCRGLMTKDFNFFLSKNVDTACPLGPCLVTKDTISDPHNLQLKCWVNGVLKQDGSSSLMLNKIDSLISFLSRSITLLPGDVILTGTPSGVGFMRQPPEYLRAGDILKSEIEGIGVMQHEVFAE